MINHKPLINISMNIYAIRTIRSVEAGTIYPPVMDVTKILAGPFEGFALGTIILIIEFGTVIMRSTESLRSAFPTSWPITVSGSSTPFNSITNWIV